MIKRVPYSKSLLFPVVRLTMVLPALVVANILGALISYQSFLAKESVLEYKLINDIHRVFCRLKHLRLFLSSLSLFINFCCCRWHVVLIANTKKRASNGGFQDLIRKWFTETYGMSKNRNVWVLRRNFLIKFIIFKKLRIVIYIKLNVSKTKFVAALFV